jgi:hypothetical protein
MTIAKLILELLDKFVFADRSVTLLAAGFIPSDSTGSRVRQAVAAIWTAWASLTAAIRRGSRGEHERYLAASVDQADLERRERAWSRDRAGSLIGW